MTINRHDMAPTEDALRHALSESWNAPRRDLKPDPCQYRVKTEELLNHRHAQRGETSCREPLYVKLSSRMGPGGGFRHTVPGKVELARQQ